MKSPLVIATAVLLFVGCALAADQPPFRADITHGNIRCVLMSVGQTTVFPNEKDNAQKAPPWRDGNQGVRCFTVTFLVEALGDAPSEPHTLKNLEVSSGGKPLRFDGGGSSRGSTITSSNTSLSSPCRRSAIRSEQSSCSMSSMELSLAWNR